MNSADLSAVLYVNQVDAEELAQIVLEVLGSGSYDSVNEVSYNRPGHPSSLHFKFERNELKTLKAGSGLSSNDISEIQSKIRVEILDLNRKIVGRMILFSAYPVTGRLRIGNLLQVSPAPNHTSTSKQSEKGYHPFLIEFEVCDSPNVSIRGYRICSKAQKLSLLLSLLAEGDVLVPSTANHFRWMRRNDPKSQYEQMLEEYGYGEFQPFQDSFTESDMLPSIELVDDQQYFKENGFTAGYPLRLPVSFKELVHAFERLTPVLQERFSRAGYWYHLAKRQESYSAYFLHLIQSIETLLPSAEPGNACSECGKDKNDGPTKRFRNFLDELVPAQPEFASARKQLYTFRSNLSHGWDICGRDFGRMNIPMSVAQTMWTVQAYHLARCALINWLNRYNLQLSESTHLNL